MDLGADSEAGRRLAVGVRDASTRTATLRAIAELDQRPEIVAVNHQPENTMAAYRALGDDEGAIASFERAVDGPRYEAIYPGQVLAVLGPELSARPRVRSAMQRFVERRRARQ
jgi:hypothetical protein